MPAASTFQAWAESIPALSYYDILRVPRNATLAQIKAAFHSFALRCHPDRYVDDAPDVPAAAAEVFKRGVEAYNVLSKQPLRERYDRALARGKLRIDVTAPESKPPPPPRPKMLEDLARTPRGKQFALKADRLIGVGKLDEARIQLINAIQNEPDNEELQGRLTALYELIAAQG
jgi:curved DNA-binding protein CbpA